VSHRLVAGLDWDEWDFDNRIPSFGYNGKALQRNLAAYVQDAMRISPDLTVSVGAREQRVRTALSEQSFGQQDASKERTVRAWELAARQNLDAEWLAYAKTGRSFRMPVVDEIRGFGFVPPALLEPQVSRDWEMGLEGVGEGRRLRLAVFRSNLENEIMYVPPPLLGANTNLPPTRREGVEVDGQFTLAPDLTLAASYAWIRARFRDGLIGGTDVTGKEIPLVPRHRAGATLSWQPAPGWQSSVTVTHTGSQVYDNDQTNSFGRRIASFTVVDLAAAWDSGPWVLRAAVLNATSEEYHTYAIANLTTGSFNAYPAALRTFLLSASYRFDRR
jgi:iron complex outermembrane receptor protein